MKNREIISKLDKLIPNPKCSLNYTKDYELLIATMLSAQSTDARVNIVTRELFKYDIHELASMETEKIEAIIKPVGTFHRKAEYVKDICQNLIDHYDGKVPHDRKFLESLKGVGHKTCNVVFAEIFHENVVAVDTHVTRVSKKLGLADADDDVIEIEHKLEEAFDKKNLGRLHLQLVLFGRHICRAQKPLCEKCPFKDKECQNR